jgi:hypothetical protein
MRHTHKPGQRWPATVGSLILGVTVGAIVGMTSRLSAHDPGLDDENPPDLATDADPAETGDDDYRDSVANDDGWPRAD